MSKDLRCCGGGHGGGGRGSERTEKGFWRNQKLGSSFVGLSMLTEMPVLFAGAKNCRTDGRPTVKSPICPCSRTGICFLLSVYII